MHAQHTELVTALTTGRYCASDDLSQPIGDVEQLVAVDEDRHSFSSAETALLDDSLATPVDQVLFSYACFQLPTCELFRYGRA